MVGLVLLAQVELTPRFQPGPARLPDRAPITQPERLDPDETLLDRERGDSGNSGNDQPVDADQAQLEAYQDQAIKVRGNTIFDDATLAGFIRECRQNTSNLSPSDWAALCITLHYQRQGYINTRVYAGTSDGLPLLDVIEGRLAELRVNGPNPTLNANTEQKLSALQGQILNANEVLWALQLIQQQPGAEQIKGRLGRVGSDPSQSSLIVRAEPKGRDIQGLLTYSNDGTITAGEHRNQALVSGESLLRFTDRLTLVGEKTWTGIPQTGSSTYSISYSTPLVHKTSGVLSVGFSRMKPVELGGIASGFRTNQVQITGLINHKFIDSYDRDLSIFGQLSFSRSNLYLNGDELPSIIPDLIRKPQSSYLKVGMEANKINRRSIHNAQLFVMQAIPASIPDDQIQALRRIDTNPANSTAIGASISTLLLLDKGIRLKAGLAGQKSFGNLINTMRFQIGADSGLTGLPSTALSGDDGLQATAIGTVPIHTIKGWSFAVKPFVGIGAVRLWDQWSDTIGSYGALLNITNPSSRFSMDVGWTGQVNQNDNLDELWEHWSLGHGLISRASLRF